MQDLTTRTLPTLDRFTWFAIFIAYLKLRTQQMPSVAELGDFENLWPTLLDQMCRKMTSQAAEALRKEVPLCAN